MNSSTEIRTHHHQKVQTEAIWGDRLIRFLTVSLLIGKAWQFFRLDPLSLHVSFLGENVWMLLQPLSVAVFSLSTIGVLLDREEGIPRFLEGLLGASTIILFIGTLGSFAAKSYQLPQLLEHSIQWSTPLIYVCIRRQEADMGSIFLFWIKLAITFTFLGHGLYALGIPELPGHFVGMTASILGLTQNQATQFLTVAGILDMLVCVGIWLPSSRRISLLYAVFWGTATALARIVAHWDWSDMLGVTDRWLPEVLIRLPHGILPLWVWWVCSQEKEK
ncbi:MAG: hypothetical protein AAGC85_07480 [Bacteroidota bacterium]